MHEIIVNIHMHTLYSDGNASHKEIAEAAMRAGIDVVIVTDHNVLVRGFENYYHDGNRRVLMLVGEELHDQSRLPQKNHLIVFGSDRELATFTTDPSLLIRKVREENSLSFFAHPDDPPAPYFDEPDISWIDWNLDGFTGIELWNAMSEFKSLLKSRSHGIYYVYNPKLIFKGPFRQTLDRWDNLLNQGKKVIAIGGSDAHAFPLSIGPIKKIVFPYEFLFRSINTHLYLEKPLSGVFKKDREIVLCALKKGRAFIGYDLLHSTNGFRFIAHGMERTAWMGDQISANRGLTFKISLPVPVECRLVKDGRTIRIWRKRDSCMYITTEPGVYRIESYFRYMGQMRGWIFSNPIYVTE